MATLDDALKLVKRDPPLAFVGLAVTAAQPPAKAIVVPLKGRQLLLPEWGPAEWTWYLQLALAIANKQKTEGDTAIGQAKVRAIAKVNEAIAAVGKVTTITTELAGQLYLAAVNLVTASEAAAQKGPSFGEGATEAFKEALVEAPATIVTALKTGLERGISNMTKVQREAARILGEIFIRPLKSVAGGLLEGLGPTGIVVIAGVLYYMFGRKR